MALTRWGDFGGACLIGPCETNADLFMPDGQVLGLVKSSSFLLGTWRTGDGELYRFLRGIKPYQSANGCYVFSTKDQTCLTRISEKEERTYRGGVQTTCIGNNVHFSPPGSEGFIHEIDGEKAIWQEEGLLDVVGTKSAPATQWYNPWRDGGGGLAVTTKFRAKGTVWSQPADGFFAHEVHYFPAEKDFFVSPYGWGGREVHWGHMSTAFEDGTDIDASMAIGPDGWGFAMLTDEKGELHQTTDLKVECELRESGYPERIYYSFLDQEWVWQIDRKGERVPTSAGGGIVGAEGVLMRVGETRQCVAAMGTIDWWLDGRAALIPIRK